MKKFTTFHKLLAVAAVCFAALQVNAQVTLIYPNATTAPFTTIQAAYNAIDFTANPGTHVIQIDATPTAETYPIALGAKTGVSSTNTVTIKPAAGAKVTIGNPNKTSIFTGVTTLTTSGVLTVTQSTANVTAGMTVYGFGPFISTAAHPTVSSFDATTITCNRNMSTAQTGTTIYVGTPDTKTIVFNGAKYVTIDGISRTDPNTGLTIQNPNSIQASTIWIDGGSSYNTIQNCFIKGANVSGMAYNNGGCGQIMFFSGENDFNTITNNDICDIDGLPMPICMVLMAYGSSSTNNDNTISNNKIYNIGNGTSPNGNVQVFGFSSTSNTTSYNNYILNNRIFWTKTAEFRTNPYIFGMGGSYNGLGNRIEGNVIGWQADGVTPAELTSPLKTDNTFYGSNVKNCTFKNNVIGGINWSSKVFVGFQIFAHNVSTPNADDVCYGNQVKDITVNSSVTGANFYGIMISTYSPFEFNIKSNIVKNITVSSPTAANTCTLNGILNNFGALFSVSITSVAGSTAATLTAGTGSLVNGTTYTLSGNSYIPVNTTFTYSGSTSITLSNAATTAGTGIAINATPASPYKINCIGNEVSNLIAGNSGSSAANTIIGFVNGGAVSTVEKNLIYNLNTKSTGTGSVIKGLRFALSNANGANIQNNIVRLGTDVTSDTEIYAIYHEGTSSDIHTFKFYHNSIYIGGTSATKNTHIFTHTGAVKSIVTLKNNIFSNVRTGGTAVNEIYNLATNSDVFSSDYNLYQYNGRMAYTATTPATTAFATLDDWNFDRLGASLTEDTNSKNQLNPLFVDPTASTPDFHMPAGSPANETGIAIATVTDDFAGMLRADYTTASTTNADMGAYAIGNSTAVETPKQLSEVSVYGMQNNIRFTNLSGKSASVYSFAGQLLKSVQLTSDNATMPATKGLYIVNVNGEVTKVMVK